MKKKYGLFKLLTIMLLLIVVATYFIKGRDGSIKYLALLDVFLNYIQAFYVFFDSALFILAVGGFYGFLNRVPAYKKLVKSIANKFSDKGKLFVIIITIIFALLSSLTGLNVLLLLFVPFAVSIILLLGYDKLVALSATIGGTIAGFIGGIFLTIKQSSSYYGTTYATIDKIVGLESHWGNLFPKILLLVVVTGLLIIYIISHIKKIEAKTTNYKLTKSDNLFVEVKDRQGKVVKVDDSKTRVWPLVTIMFILLVILVLGYMPWNSLFEIDCFEKFHTWLTGLKIGDYAVFTNLVSSIITAFGTWGSLGNYMVGIIVLVILMLITMLIYRVKFEDAMDGFVYGAKKMIPATMIVMLALCIFICCYNNGFIETIITNAGKEFGDNVVVHSLLAALGSILHVDLYYTSSAIFTTITGSLTSTANLSIYAIMFQSIYGLVQLIGPTSILLIVGISYLDVPYITWLKYIWRFIIQLIIVILVVLMIVSLL